MDNPQYYSAAYPKIEEIVSDIFKKIKVFPEFKKITKIRRIRSPLSEFKFLSQCNSFSNIYGSDYENNIKFGFHGTSHKNLTSIINNGLYAPYEEKYSVRCGNKYGKGVYLSETIGFASRYNSGCMILAAIACGNYKILAPNEAGLYSRKEIDADCFIVTPEIVVRGTTQILPLFVIDINNDIIVPNISPNPTNQSIDSVNIINDITDVNIDDDIFKNIETINTISIQNFSISEKIKNDYPNILLCTISHLVTLCPAEYHTDIDIELWVREQLDIFDYEL